MKYLNDAWQSLQLITVMDIIDVLIVAVLVYKLLRVIRHTNAEKLFKGIVVVLVATMLANAAELNEISFLLNQLMVIGPTAIVIIFQLELRKMLEQFGAASCPFSTGPMRGILRRCSWPSCAPPRPWVPWPGPKQGR